MTTYHPIDFDALEKGDTIHPETIEEAYSCERGTPEYQLALLRLRERIELELKGRGLQVTVSSVKESLKVLTDSEALIYNDRAFRQGRRRLVRTHARTCGIAAEMLSSQEQRSLENSTLNQGRLLQAMRSENRKLAAERRARELPPSTQSE